MMLHAALSGSILPSARESLRLDLRYMENETLALNGLIRWKP